MKSYSTGHLIVLGKELARSGQGVIYRSEPPGTLAKIYRAHDEPERYQKLKCMLENPPADATQSSLSHVSIAWPRDLVLDRNNQCVGLTMPHVTDGCELTKLYNPILRAQLAPRFNWFYLHSTAFNYASALECIHNAGHVVGDIKPQNILVNPKALISIIDTDSFQICDPKSGKVYRCPVGSESFTPRELLEKLNGGGFAEVDRNEYHDRFGLGVIIYLLLFGRHPFTEGRYLGHGDPPSPDERVRRGLWLYSETGLIVPDPTTISLRVLHPELAAAFDRCFTRGHMDPTVRPSAKEWRTALAVALDDLKTCEREPNHYHSRQGGECFWCLRRELVGIDIFSPEPRAKPVPQVAAVLAEPYTLQTATAPRRYAATAARPRRVPSPSPAIYTANTKAPAPSRGGWGFVGFAIWLVLWAVARSSYSPPAETAKPAPLPTPQPRRVDVPSSDREMSYPEQRQLDLEMLDALRRGVVKLYYKKMIVGDLVIYYPPQRAPDYPTYVLAPDGVLYKKYLELGQIDRINISFKLDRSWERVGQVPIFK